MDATNTLALSAVDHTCSQQQRSFRARSCGAARAGLTPGGYPPGPKHWTSLPPVPHLLVAQAQRLGRAPPVAAGRLLHQALHFRHQLPQGQCRGGRAAAPQLLHGMAARLEG